MPTRNLSEAKLFLVNNWGVTYELELKDIDSIGLTRESTETRSIGGRIVAFDYGSVSLNITCKGIDITVNEEAEKEETFEPAPWEEMILRGIATN